jgi:hypothetical protein
MSRLTGTDAYGLMEAYGAVYAPQELTEEQVWEGVGEWVNALLEEGYDLSEYTWEDMYEAYLEQLDEGAADAGVAVRKGIGNAAGSYFNAVKGVAKGYADVAGSQLKGLAGQTTTSTNPLARAGNAVTRAVSAPSRAAAGFAKGLVTGQGDTPAKPKMPGLPPSAKKVTQYPQGVSTGVGGGNAGASRQPPAARPATPAPAPAARPAAGAATPAARPAAPAAKAAPAATAPSTAAIGFKLAQQGVDLAAPKKPSLRSDIDDLKNMRTASRQRQGLTQSFDPFDVVLGHLIDEGYADTEESATAIMANMSEEWRQSIVEGMFDFLPKSTTVISNKPEDKRNLLQKYRDATKPLFAGLPKTRTVIQKPQPRGREFTNPPS